MPNTRQDFYKHLISRGFADITAVEMALSLPSNDRSWEALGIVSETDLSRSLNALGFSFA